MTFQTWANFRRDKALEHKVEELSQQEAALIQSPGHPPHGQSFNRLGLQAAPSSSSRSRPPDDQSGNAICWSRDPKPRVPLLPANPQATKSPNPHNLSTDGAPVHPWLWQTTQRSKRDRRAAPTAAPSLTAGAPQHPRPGSVAAVAAPGCTQQSSCNCSRCTTASSHQIPRSVIPRPECFLLCLTADRILVEKLH